jgi:arabinofuranosyltransferase
MNSFTIRTPQPARQNRTHLSSGSADLLLSVAGVVLFVLNLWAYRHLYVDDAFISFRYSESLARGDGLSWNPDGPPVAGFSNLLWALILAPFSRLGIPLLPAARALAILSAVGTLVLLRRFIRRHEIVDSSRGLILGAFTYLLLGNRSLAVHSVSGLETVLHLFLVSWAVITVLDRQAGRSGGIARPLVAFALVFLSRPEGIAVGGLLSLLWLLRSRGWQRAMVPGGLAILYGAYILWHWKYFSSPFPNAFYVKVGLDGELAERAIYGARFMVENLFVLAVALPVLFQAQYRAVFLVVAFYMIFGVAIRPYMGFHHRFIYPCFPALALAAAIGFERVSRFLEKRSWIRVGAVLFLAPLSLASVRCLLTWPPGCSEFVKPGGLLVHREREVGEAMGSWDLPRRPVLAFGDAGVIPYLSGFEVIDDVGLNDPLIAHAQSAEEAIQSIISRRPDLAVMPMAKLTNRLEDTFPYGHGIIGTHQFEYHQALLDAGFHSVAVVPTASYGLNILVRQDSDLKSDLEKNIRRTWPAYQIRE